jgi:hypothetical protein
MDQRRRVQDYDLDDNVVRDLSILLGVVAAAFIVIGAVAYMSGGFGDDKSASAANNPPATMTKPPERPSTTGQGSAK